MKVSNSALVLMGWTLLALVPAHSLAQTTVLSESFSAALTPGWVVGDSNTAAPALWWGTVPEAYGSGGAHSRQGKGYCAAFGPLNFTNLTATYSSNLLSTMSRTINLTPYSFANLRFWALVPSIGRGDSWGVLVNNSTVASGATAVTPWAENRVSLNSFAGGSRLLRFVFASDGSGLAEGLYLDDIELTGANAPLTESLTTFGLFNYTGYVIDSDASNANPGFNRDGLNVNASLHLENFSGVTTNVPYVFTYQLRDTNGSLFPIFNAGGATTNNGYTYITTNAATLLSAQETNFVNSASLKPAARLNHRSAYRIELAVARTNGAVVFASTNGPYHFYHFTNLVSADPAFNLIAELQGSGWQQTFLLNPSPGSNTFLITNQVALHRYDAFAAGSPSIDSVPLKLDVELRNATTDALVPLVISSSNYPALLSSYTFGTSNPPTPREITNQLVFQVKAASQLDSVNASYKAIVRLSYTNQAGIPAILAESVTNAPQQLLAFNGRLICGDINATMHSFNSVPVAGVTTPGSNVAVTITLSPNSATVDGVNGPTFGNGAPLGAKLLVNGDALLVSGTQPLNNATDGSQGNISFTRTGTTLGGGGATVGTVNFHMPVGFGYQTNPTAATTFKRYLTDLAFNNIGLNQSLAPKTNLALNFANIYGAEESKPLYLLATQMLWSVSQSRFELRFDATSARAAHVRIIDYATLSLYASNLVQTNMAVKRANDRYFNHVAGFTGPALITADAAGMAQLSGTLSFNATGAFETHFPYQTSVQWSGGGTMTINNDFVVPGTGSSLSGVASLQTPYVGDCEGCTSTPTTNHIGITPLNGQLFFTRDGGLIAQKEGPILYQGVLNKLAWGYIPDLNDHAQAALAPTNLTFHMPGPFLRGADNPADDDDGPGVMLFTGVGAVNLNLIERPNTPAYYNGLADYAGINVRAVQDSFLDGRSVIAGTPVNYKLRGNSKYYARLGGVSGIHSAVGGTFPANLLLWGYQFGFSNYSLAYLDNQNVASRTDGNITLPYPSAITLDFEQLTLTCSGKPSGAKLPASTTTKYLTYWNADIEPLALGFVSDDGQDCNVGNGFLTLGVQGYASSVTSPLNGTLGFFPDGTLISKSDNHADLDSRLQLPNSFQMKGANKVDYEFTSVGNAYYNRFNANTAPDGFITFAGQMNVPFFEDIRVHVHSSAKNPATLATPSPAFLMGGWTRADLPGQSHGWLDANGQNYFNAAYFDPQNLGWPGPPTVGLDTYRNNTADEFYHPRAQKLWLDIVELDYALKWNSGGRNFSSFSAVSNDFIVFKVTHQATTLDAKAAALDFGATYGAPKISTASLFLDALDDAGAFNTLSNAIGANATLGLLNSMLSLNQLLADTGTGLLETSLNPVLDPLMETHYQALKLMYQTSSPPWKFTNYAQVYLSNSTATGMGGSISNALYDFASGTGQANDLISNITYYLTQTTNGITQTTNAFGSISNMANSALTFIGSVYPEASNAAAPVVMKIVQDIQPTLDDISTALGQVNVAVGTSLGVLHQGGEWANEIHQITVTGQQDLKIANDTLRAGIVNFLTDFDYSVDNPFQQYGKQQFKERMRREIREAFLASPVWAKIQTSIKQRLYDGNLTFRSGVDSYFDGINGLVRGAIGAALSGLDDTINSAINDNIGKYMGAAQITGHADINEDGLRRLRLDGQFTWKIPEDMVFKAFLEILELDSENSAAGCHPDGGTATEVTIGALDVPCDWLSKGLKVDVTGKFVLDDDGVLRGLGGSVLAKGSIKLGTVEIKQIGFAVMFGEFENYVAATARARINNSIEVGGGIYAGKTCSYDPIKFAMVSVSPTLAGEIKPEEIFGELPLAGAFFFADGEFPVWSYGCLFEVRLIVGGGAWYFNDGANYGGIVKAGVSGTVICILKASGSLTLIGTPRPEGFTLLGVLHADGCFGPCPLCICGSTDKTMKYVEGHGWSEVDD